MAPVYAGHVSNLLVQRTFSILRTLNPEAIFHELQEGEPATTDACIFFSSDGNFPNKFLRIVKLSDQEKRKIQIPDYAQYAEKAIALNMASASLILQHHPNFHDALKALDAKLYPRIRTTTPKRVKTRAEWRSGHHAHLRESHSYPL